MKKIIKKILKSRINKDDEIKNNNIVLSKRSYKYLDFLINKMFKKFLILSIYSNYERFKNFDLNFYKNQIIDQQDLISILSILVPGKLFEYTMYKIIGKKNKQEEEQDKEEEEQDHIMSSLFIKNKIIQQNYIGEFKFTQCFIRALRLILNLIVNELIDCCLHYIYSINKRKNIIDLIDLLNTIDQDDDFRILFKKLTYGCFKDNANNPYDKLYPVCQSALYDWDKEKFYKYFNKEAKKVQQYRDNKPISIYCKISNNGKGLEITKKTIVLDDSNNSIVKTYTNKTFKEFKKQPNKIGNRTIQFIGLSKEERTLENLESLCLNELKKHSKDLNLKTYGKKSDLAKRIVEHYQNESKSGKRLLSKNIATFTKKVLKDEESKYFIFKSVQIQVYIDTYKVVDPTDPNSIYFEFEDFTGITGKSDDDICIEEYGGGGGDDDDDDDDDDSFIYGEYTDDEDDIASEIDGLDIYNFDYNQFYKDQLVLFKKSNPTLYSKLLKKSPRYVWKNKDQLNKVDKVKIEQYKLAPLQESDDEDYESEEEDDEEKDEETDEDFDSGEEEEEDDDEYEEMSDSADLYDYEAFYDDLMGTDAAGDINDYKLTPYTLYKKRVKYGFDHQEEWDQYRYDRM